MFSIVNAMLLVLAIMMPGQGDLSKRAYKKSHKELTKTFGDSLRTSQVPLADSIRKTYQMQENSVFRVSDEEKESIMILATAKGRYDHFEFMVLFDKELNISIVKILIYRSNHGYEITNRKWLEQFYKESKPYRYGKNIDAISGATLSGKAITQKMNELTKAVKLILKQHK